MPHSVEVCDYNCTTYRYKLQRIQHNRTATRWTHMLIGRQIAFTGDYNPENLWGRDSLDAGNA